MELSKYFHESWYKRLKHYLESSDFNKQANKIAKERKINVVYPLLGSETIFKAFRVTPFDDVKVVILGQDPYHSSPEAFDGLAFSNSLLEEPQPSLENILEEVENDVYDGFNLERLTNYSLYSWADQGVLLTNVAHTVVKGKPQSHLHIWRDFTKEVIKSLNEKDNIVWLLWGRFAQKHEELITNTTHHIIKTSHPSPLGVNKEAPIPFTDSKCFSKCNQYLKDKNLTEIIW